MLDPREVVVDLVGKPGFVYGVDSLINAKSSLPSPLRLSHLKDHEGFDVGVSSGLLAGTMSLLLNNTIIQVVVTYRLYLSYVIDCAHSEWSSINLF